MPLFLKTATFTGLGPVTDMNEPVKPVVVSFFMRFIFKACPWKALDPEAKLFATVNQTDIRVLRARKRTGTQDDDSSGAASIFLRASWVVLNRPLHKVTPRVLRSVAPPPGPGLSKKHFIFQAFAATGKCLAIAHTKPASSLATATAVT